MSTLPSQRRSRALWPDLAEMFGDFGWRPVFGSHVMRLEDETKDGRYELRAEIPGVDPVNDIDITLHHGELTIKAERSEKRESKGRSEFSYGSFVRTVSLPAGADENDIKATYDKGILTVSVGLSEPKPTEKHIQVQRGN